MTESERTTDDGSHIGMYEGVRANTIDLTYDEAKRLCEYSLDIVCISNFSGQVLWSNNVDSLITGYSKEELSKISWPEITHPDDVAKVSESLQVVSEGELRPCTEIRIRCKDGSYKWISWSGVPVIEENKIYSIGRDVTARKTAEAEIKKLASIVQSSSEAILSIDEKGNISSWNHGAELLYGYEAEEVIGRAACVLFPRTKLPSILLTAPPNCAESVQEVHHRRDNSEVEVSLSLFPITDEFGLHSGTAAIVRDISKQKAAERCIAQFYSITSHELRTPLSSIRGVLGLLEGGLVNPNTDEGRDLIGLARTSCDRLVTLINDILDARNFDSGALEFNKQYLNTDELVAQAVANTAPMALESAVKVIASVPGAHLKGDKARLIQVLTNLLSNAIKFSPAGATVQVGGRLTERNTIRFVVTDQGPGIPRHERENLFRRFRQLDPSDTRTKEGVGLGLSIAKTIIEQHDGAIGLDPEYTGGSSFWFEIPLAPVAAKAGV